MGSEMAIYMLVKKRDIVINYDVPDEDIKKAAKMMLLERDGIDKPTNEQLSETVQGLKDSIQNVKDAIEMSSRDLCTLSGKDYDYFLTGGATWGDSPTELSEDFDKLVLTELDARMGFEKEWP